MTSIAIAIGAALIACGLALSGGIYEITHTHVDDAGHYKWHIVMNKLTGATQMCGADGCFSLPLPPDVPR
jgi:hypothetical protein